MLVYFFRCFRSLSRTHRPASFVLHLGRSLGQLHSEAKLVIARATLRWAFGDYEPTFDLNFPIVGSEKGRLLRKLEG